jgi:tRNA-Thr(GGU) m(6)t(6)A37 methyltransferase TsaA
VTFTLNPVGRVARTEDSVSVRIPEAYRDCLKLLDEFSHIYVIWWAHEHDNEQSRRYRETEPPYAPGRTHGIFATRAEYRPNPIAITVCEVLDVDLDAGAVRIRDIDALDGTPVVDIKPYYPVCDRVKDARIPEWLSDWPDWFPEEGFGLT